MKVSKESSNASHLQRAPSRLVAFGGIYRLAHIEAPTSTPHIENLAIDARMNGDLYKATNRAYLYPRRQRHVPYDSVAGCFRGNVSP